MYCCIDGKVSESIIKTKFGTLYYNVSSAYIPNVSYKFPCVCLHYHFDYVSIHWCFFIHVC
jgi:hypothetical protein